MADYLFHDCLRESAWHCPFEGKRLVGNTVFHGHATALGKARHTNMRAGRKVTKVVMNQGHFHIVKI